MNALLTIAGQEVRAGIRNRWVAATTAILAALALSLVLLGSAPGGTTGASPLAVVVVSLAGLTIFLVPLIALLLSFDAVVGEAERGTLLLLLAYPVARWQIVLGKFLGHTAILALATVVGYGAAGLLLFATRGADPADWAGFATLIGTSVLLGAAFVGLGGLASIAVRERATAAGLAVGLWLVFVLLYDAALLGLLVADQGATVSGGLFDALLLLNPADVYRLINLTGSGGAALLSGMSAPGEVGQLPVAALYAALAAWILLPLGLGVLLFNRRQP
ncbi:Cu-processing system permease protein [Tistlia consotensis]|uniref:Cu-processing system permease protein n=1 Tax=Tistlia consotensis USBA 355 TaxID=560819 RepID=A0A1Y6BNR7_9PROT|nr:ABC transporter permease subunit [Tistlia consotensis]SMF21595.1 Cu-processing system permease protein [Tistlia consotensis USBA 355]SNR46762.1 Cu-processing system permease protein [Tistlia consotensis]